MGESFKEYITAFGRWGWAVAILIIGDCIGIAHSILFH
jgi:hypothetical protein